MDDIFHPLAGTETEALDGGHRRSLLATPPTHDFRAPDRRQQTAVPRAGTPPSGAAGRAAEIMVNRTLRKSTCHSGTVNGYFANIRPARARVPESHP